MRWGRGGGLPDRTFGHDEIIVSKTDRLGKIVYANDVFCRVSGYSEPELIGKPHSIVRHGAMPRCVFRILWRTISAGDEIFAFVINKAKDGRRYDVFAHVTPIFGPDGAIVGYHSNRRRPSEAAMAAVEPLYAALVAEEARFSSLKDGMDAAEALLGRELDRMGVSYGQLVFSL